MSLLIFLYSLPTARRFIIISQDSQQWVIYTLKPRTNQLLFTFARMGELKNRLLKVMEIEEMNVDLCCTGIANISRLLVKVKETF